MAGGARDRRHNQRVYITLARLRHNTNLRFHSRPCGYSELGSASPSLIWQLGESPCLNRISRYCGDERIAMTALEPTFVSFHKIDLRAGSAAFQDITQKGDAKS